MHFYDIKIKILIDNQRLGQQYASCFYNKYWYFKNKRILFEWYL